MTTHHSSQPSPTPTPTPSPPRRARGAVAAPAPRAPRTTRSPPPPRTRESPATTRTRRRTRMNPSPSLRTPRARRPPRASVCGATATLARGRRRMLVVVAVFGLESESRVDGMSHRSIPNIDRARRTHRSNIAVNGAGRRSARRGPWDSLTCSLANARAGGMCARRMVRW